MHRSAVLSDCGHYRYSLRREWGTGLEPLYGFVGVNPSTADADVEDATTKKWRGFVERWGGSGYLTTNLYAYRTTDVRGLADAEDPRGPGNLAHILAMAKEVDVIVPCWGTLIKVPRKVRSKIYVGSVLRALLATGKPVKCLGLNNDGQPRHPLMLPYSTQLQTMHEPGEIR